MSGPAIEVESLVKTYDGHRVLDGVDLSVASGSVFGFLGRNGAGKTTTLRILLGLARPDGGSARVLGRDVTRAGVDLRAEIGFLPDVPGFYPWMTGAEFLRFCGELFGLRGPARAERVDVLLDLAGLTGVDTPVGGYSRGMKQRLGIAQALINAPRVLFLDEPTSALDPVGRRDVLEMIGSLAGRTTVLFSTHILADVERVADTVAIIERGRVLRQAPIGELLAGYGASHRLLLQVDGGEAAAQTLAAALRAQPWASRVDRVHVDGSPAVQVAAEDLRAARHAVPGLLADAGLGLVRCEPVEASLEEVFLDLVGESRGRTR
ncbi:MAG: ABC transporter ATP-binding protein [Austwickia sp.]|nr:ABC transporter ATP-binding protein [Austwickia sp.]